MSATMQLDATLAPGVADVDKFEIVDENGNEYNGYFKGKQRLERNHSLEKLKQT